MKNRTIQPPPIIDIAHCVLVLIMAGVAAYAGGELIAEKRYVVGVLLCIASVAAGVYIGSFWIGGRFSD